MLFVGSLVLHEQVRQAASPLRLSLCLLASGQTESKSDLKKQYYMHMLLSPVDLGSVCPEKTVTWTIGNGYLQLKVFSAFSKRIDLTACFSDHILPPPRPPHTIVSAPSCFAV